MLYKACLHDWDKIINIDTTIINVSFLARIYLFKPTFTIPIIILPVLIQKTKNYCLINCFSQKPFTFSVIQKPFTFSVIRASQSQTEFSLHFGLSICSYSNCTGSQQDPQWKVLHFDSMFYFYYPEQNLPKWWIGEIIELSYLKKHSVELARLNKIGKTSIYTWMRMWHRLSKN